MKESTWVPGSVLHESVYESIANVLGKPRAEINWSTAVETRNDRPGMRLTGYVPDDPPNQPLAA